MKTCQSLVLPQPLVTKKTRLHFYVPIEIRGNHEQKLCVHVPYISYAQSILVKCFKKIYQLQLYFTEL